MEFLKFSRAAAAVAPCGLCGAVLWRGTSERASRAIASGGCEVAAAGTPLERGGGRLVSPGSDSVRTWPQSSDVVPIPSVPAPVRFSEPTKRAALNLTVVPLEYATSANCWKFKIDSYESYERPFGDNYCNQIFQEVGQQPLAPAESAPTLRCR